MSAAADSAVHSPNCTRMLCLDEKATHSSDLAVHLGGPPPAAELTLVVKEMPNLVGMTEMPRLRHRLSRLNFSAAAWRSASWLCCVTFSQQDLTCARGRGLVRQTKVKKMVLRLGFWRRMHSGPLATGKAGLYLSPTASLRTGPVHNVTSRHGRLLVQSHQCHAEAHSNPGTHQPHGGEPLTWQPFRTWP